MNRKIYVLLATMLILTCLSAICFARPTSFVSVGKYKEVLLEKTAKFTFKQDDEKIVFRADSSGYLHLDGRKSGEDYLSFIPNDKNHVADKYLVREVKADYPKMTLYEISAVVGDSNVGYWLVSKMKGQWTSLVSYDSLYSMGMKSGAIHKLDSHIENGLFVIRTSVNGVTDCDIELFWDDSEKRFGMNKHN